jgi:threonine dehydrogenase-like Zn-dependent dehydrogenase
MTTQQLANSWSVYLRDDALVSGPVEVPDGSHEASVSVYAKVLVGGVCRSDLKELAGTRHGMRTFGHEVVAEVESVHGPSDIEVGMRFVLDPHADVGWTSSFATDMIVWGASEAVQTALRPVSTLVNPECAVFTEPLACAIRCVNAALEGLATGSMKALVYGAGQFGVIIATVLARRGVDVTMTNRSAGRLDWLRDRIERPRSLYELKTQSELADNAYDLVVDASAVVTPAVYNLLARVVKANGRVHVFAGTAPGESNALGIDLDLVRRQQLCVATSMDGKPIDVTGSHGARTADFETANRLISDSSDPMLLDFMICERVSLADLPYKLQEIAASSSYGKSVVTPAVGDSGGYAALTREGDRFVLKTYSPGDAAVVVQPLIVGLCGTDVQMIVGDRPADAAILGHEVVGRVSWSVLDEYPTGAIVVASPVSQTNPEKVMGHSSPGALTERMEFSAADIAEHCLVRYDGPLDIGSMVEPAACVNHGLRATGLDVGLSQSVAVLGDGALASIAAIMATSKGHRVVMFTKSGRRAVDRRQLLGDACADVSSGDDIDGRYLSEFDVVLNCTTRKGARAAVAMAARLLRPGGYLDMIAGVGEGDAADDHGLARLVEVRASNVCGEVHSRHIDMTIDGTQVRGTGHRGAGPQDFEAAISSICRYPALFRSLIAKTVTLVEAGRLFESWVQGNVQDEAGGGRKTVVLMPALLESGYPEARWRPQVQARLVGATS